MFQCQESGRVAAACRGEGRNHHAGSATCPQRVKEVKVKIRAEEDWSHAEDQRMERNDKMVAVQKELEQE